MKIVAGINDARILAAGTHNGAQRMLVVDGNGEVRIELSSNWPAGLSIEQARYLAVLLTEAADRLDEGAE